MRAEAWIDRVKTAKGIETDYAAAKTLGVSRAVVSSYRGKIETMDEEIAIKIATALSINPIVILTDQAMEKAKSETAKKAWATALEKLKSDSALYIMSSK